MKKALSKTSKHMQVNASHHCQSKKTESHFKLTASFFWLQFCCTLIWEPVNTVQLYPTHLPRIFWSGQPTEKIFGETTAVTTTKYDFLSRIKNHKEQAKIKEKNNISGLQSFVAGMSFQAKSYWNLNSKHSLEKQADPWLHTLSPTLKCAFWKTLK